MILPIYTIIHTLISLVGIFTGLVVLFGMLAGKRLDGWTKWFLICSDKRDGVLFSVPWFYAGLWSGHHIIVSAGSRDLCALSASARRALALDLRRHGCGRSLLQLLRWPRAVV